MIRAVIHAAGILGLAILIHGIPTILVRQQLLYLPVVGFGSHAELQVFLGDGVPVLEPSVVRTRRGLLPGDPGKTYLVDHHHAQEITDRGHEQSVQIVLGAIADRVAQHVQGYLAADEEEDTKRNVPERPAVLQGVDYEDNLQDDVDEEADAVEEVQDDEKSHRLCWSQPRPALEGAYRHGPTDQEHSQGGNAQKPDRQSGAILIELKADKAVDHEAHAKRRGQAILHRGEVGIDRGRRRNEARIENERADGEHHVDVKECGNLLAPWAD